MQTPPFGHPPSQRFSSGSQAGWTSLRCTRSACSHNHVAQNPPALRNSWISSSGCHTGSTQSAPKLTTKATFGKVFRPGTRRQSLTIHRTPRVCFVQVKQSTFTHILQKPVQVFPQVFSGETTAPSRFDPQKDQQQQPSLQDSVPFQQVSAGNCESCWMHPQTWRLIPWRATHGHWGSGFSFLDPSYSRALNPKLKTSKIP